MSPYETHELSLIPFLLPPSNLQLPELHRAAVQVLVRELGIVNTIRFIQQYSVGKGDYTAERDELLGNPSADELAAEIYHFQEAKCRSTRDN